MRIIWRFSRKEGKMGDSGINGGTEEMEGRLK